MNRYKKVILELKKFPESQEVMDNPDWFPIVDGGFFNVIIGNSAYVRVLDDSEYILVEKTTADEFNPMEELEKLTVRGTDDCMITYRDPGDENEG